MLPKVSKSYSMGIEQALIRYTDEWKILEARLYNWGLFCRVGGFPKLGYPTWNEIMREYMSEPGAGRISPNEIDGMHLENVISSLNVISRGGMGMGELYAFILKLEYIERGRPIRAKAEHVRHKFRCKCGERAYYYHYYGARKAVATFAGSL